MYGLNGRILEVDLTTNNYRVVEVEEKIYKLFMGGRGLATYILAKTLGEKWRLLDPLSPEIH